MRFTINEWAIVALVFVLGWLLGLASRSDRRWRRQYEEERAAHEALRREHDTRIAAANARITELERRDPPVGAVPSGAAVATGAAAVVTPVAAGAAVPSPAGRDDLTRIDGIDAHDENRLHEAGIHNFRDIVALSGVEATALEGRLGYAHGRIQNQRWREQAAALADGDANRSVTAADRSNVTGL
jgi:predicted flap endonuclease-1-like 5' DNA nuclease